MKRTLLALSLAAAFAAPAHAGFDMELLGENFAIDLSESMHEALGAVYAPRLMSSRVVKGAPYSAEVITETNQPLADGNVISHKTVGAIYRDGEGRTRQETGAEGRKQSVVYINDPVASTHIVLMPQSKRAIVMPRSFPMGHYENTFTRDKQVIRVGPREIRIEDGKVLLDGRDVTDGKVDIKVNNREVHVENGRVTVDGKEVSPNAPKVIVKTIPEKETGDGTRREEVRVQVVRIGDGKEGKEIVVPMPPTPPMPPSPGALAPMPPMPPIPGIETLRFESMGRLGKGVTTQLPAKDFDGVRAEGKSVVWTIPAGQIGNRSAIQVTSESWYSPDLKATVYSRYNDPRTGESIYRLANIRRAEPARDLFTIPAEYDTRDKSAKRKEKERDRERDRKDAK